MFATRLTTALLALGVFLAALFLLPPLAWMVCLLPALLIGAREWAALAGYRSTASWVYAAATAAGGAALAGGTSFDLTGLHVAIYLAAMAFWLIVAPGWLRAHWRVPRLALAAIGWVALIPMWLALVQLQATAVTLILFLGVVWIADTTAYLAGRRWGRHKLAPTVSPGKTWEGIAGAAIGVGVYFVALQLFGGELHPALTGFAGAAAFAALLALSVEGDLFESLLKRQAGVKDSGTLLPGHGGVLDRVDGLTATLPAVALLVHYLG